MAKVCDFSGAMLSKTPNCFRSRLRRSRVVLLQINIGRGRQKAAFVSRCVSRNVFPVCFPASFLTFSLKHRCLYRYFCSKYPKFSSVAPSPLAICAIGALFKMKGISKRVSSFVVSTPHFLRWSLSCSCYVLSPRNILAGQTICGLTRCCASELWFYCKQS